MGRQFKGHQNRLSHYFRNLFAAYAFIDSSRLSDSEKEALGMADARSLVAALALGADGINMGTRFLATKEAPVHENVKQAILNATELDTRLVMRPLRNTDRVLNNPGVERILEKEQRLGANISFADIAAEVAGVYPKVMRNGEMDAGAWSCGMVAGLIHDIPTAGELIERIAKDAERIVSERLARLVSSAPGS